MDGQLGIGIHPDRSAAMSDSTGLLAIDHLDNDSFTLFDEVDYNGLFDELATSGPYRDTLLQSCVTENSQTENGQASSCPEDLEDVIPEHLGPGCWLSICLPRGTDWAQQQTGTDDFAGITAELSGAWSKLLKLNRNEATLKSPEPEPELAWTYSNAYFNGSIDSLFGVLDRQEFETRLRRWQTNPVGSDPAWHALRNVVYATGCRIHHSANNVTSFVNIQQEAWSYFSNSLLVHSDLLLRRPTVMAVRALLAMSLFAEGLGSPALGYGLIVNAMLLSQSLGLHRQVKTAENVPCDDRSRLQRLFWAVYCCEKSIGRRTGHPSVIDDDMISCELPQAACGTSCMSPEALKALIGSCRLSGRVCQKLMSLKNQGEDPLKVLNTVGELSEDLHRWQESLPEALRPRDSLKQLLLLSDMTSVTQTLVHCSFYDLVMTIHSPLTYPWITSQFQACTSSEVNDRLKSQAGESSKLVAQASRNVIIWARQFDFNGANTHAFMLHYPMHAFINLFIYVVQNPASASAQSDLALLDMAAGYFGSMDFVTGSNLSFPFCRHLAAIGRRATERHEAHVIDQP